MSKVSDWLEGQGLGKYADVFVENLIAWTLMSKLTSDDQNELGLNIGERCQFLEAASGLGDPTVESIPATQTDAALSSGGAERRQLTVMFCG